MSNVVNSVIQFGGSTNVLDYVLKHQVAEINPKEVVDFGAGGGKNGKLVRDVLGNTCKLVAVEGFEKTAQMLDENGIYDEVLYMLIQAWIQMNSKCYDLVIFGDVLEHLDLKEINKVINHSLKNFNHIIVVVPLRDIFQDEMYGNPLEIHRTYITSSFFDQYNPIEKHIVILEKYTVMNVHIITRMQKVKLYKRLSSSIFHLIMLFLQPLGLARPLVNFLKRFFHKYKWLLRD